MMTILDPSYASASGDGHVSMDSIASAPLNSKRLWTAAAPVRPRRASPLQGSRSLFGLLLSLIAPSSTVWRFSTY